MSSLSGDVPAPASPSVAVDVGRSVRCFRLGHGGGVAIAKSWAETTPAETRRSTILLDAKKGLTDEDRQILQRLAEFPSNVRARLVLNKVDIVKRDTLLALTKDANEAVQLSRTFMISALTGDGVRDLLDHLAEKMPEGPFLYPEEQMTDLPLRFLAAEITREKLTLRLPRRAALSRDRRDGKMDGDEEGGQDRPDDLCRA